ncbi:MAG: hypothetical protein JXJ04_20490 [Spirochaetales bacterium]|nr:hypothetical protein [Spirochaetales bacterium]
MNKNSSLYILNILCYLAGCIFVWYVWITTNSFSWFAAIIVGLCYSILFIIFNSLKIDFYPFIPERIRIFERRKSRRFKFRYFLVNQHFLLLISIAGLLSYFNGVLYSRIEKYPVVKGNIVIFFKQQQSVLGLNYSDATDNDMYRLSLHTVEIVKQGITDMALKKTGETIAEETKDYAKKFFKNLFNFDIKELMKTIDNRIKYNGDPILLMNIELYTYSAHPVSARQATWGLSDSTYRNTPVFSGPIVLRDGLQEKSLINIPQRPRWGAVLPDSLNFLRKIFKEKKYYTRYYSTDYEKDKIRQNKPVEPDLPPVLIWLNNDCKEPPEREQFILENNQLRHDFFRNFFGKKLFINIRGFNQYVREGDGTTAYKTLQVEKYFDHIISLPVVDWGSRYVKTKQSDFEAQKKAAIKKLHDELTPLIRTLDQGVKISYIDKFVEEEVYTFDYSYVILVIITPFFIWLLIMILRCNFFIIFKYKI